MRIRPQTAPLSTYTPTLSLAIQRRITGQGRQHHPWKAEGERGSKSSGPGRWGCSFEGVPLPFSPPHHFPVMAQSEATSHRNSHRQGEKWMCASALNGDANLARGPPPWQGKKRFSNWLLFLGMVFTQVLLLCRDYFPFLPQVCMSMGGPVMLSFEGKEKGNKHYRCPIHPERFTVSSTGDECHANIIIAPLSPPVPISPKSRREAG